MISTYGQGRLGASGQTPIRDQGLPGSEHARWGATIFSVTPTAVIVDDHEGFRAMARQMLEDAGFEVVGEASNGAGALAMVAAMEPAVVLLDVQLPDIDGFTVAADLSRTSPRALVVLTSVRNADDYGQARVAPAPMRRFIAKADLSGAKLAELVGGRP